MGASMDWMVCMRGTPCDIRNDILADLRWADAANNGMTEVQVKFDPADDSKCLLYTSWDSGASYDAYITLHPDLFDFAVDNATLEYSNSGDPIIAVVNPCNS